MLRLLISFEVCKFPSTVFENYVLSIWELVIAWNYFFELEIITVET